MIYKSPLFYEKKYNNESCKKENKEIKKYLDKYLDEKIFIDLGCGTGLGRKMTNKYQGYVGIDKSFNMIKFCLNNYNDEFYYMSAEEAAKKLIYYNAIALFSLNYMNPKIILDINKKMKNVFIAVHYNKPYLCKTSYYYNKKWLFLFKHALKQFIISIIFKKLKAKTIKLLGEEYYYITILNKKL